VVVHLDHLEELDLARARVPVGELEAPLLQGEPVTSRGEHRSRER
jgi:hypothetical protein